MFRSRIKIRNYEAFNDAETFHAMIAYLQETARNWYEKHPNKWFTARSFFGGVNFDWKSTPLQALNDFYNPTHNPAREAYAVRMASIVTGSLLARALDNDPHVFETQPGYLRRYRWTGQVNN